MDFRRITVLTDGEWIDIELETLVPGDRIRVYEDNGKFNCECTVYSVPSQCPPDGNWVFEAVDMITEGSDLPCLH